MSVSEATSVLRRKAAVGRQEYQARAMTAARALRLSLPKVGDEEFDMALAVIGLTQNTVPQAKVTELAQDTALLMLLDGEDGRSAAAIADAGFARALIQQQTMGQVFQQLDPDAERRPTRTEAMLCAPLVDTLLSKAAALPEVEDDARLLSGLRFGDWVQSPRLLDIALEEAEYEHFALTSEIAGGVAQGRLDLLLPKPAPPEQRLTSAAELAEPMAKLALELPAELNVVLGRLQVSLSDVVSLRPGDAISIPAEGLENAEILGISGKCLGRGKLGQVGGKRAIRPVVPVAPAQVPQRRSTDAAAADGSFEAGSAGTIDMPSMADPGAADLPMALPDAGDAGPDLIDMPALPDMAGDQGVPDLPPMGDDLPEMSDLPDMPETSDLPDLDDLPDLADASDAPALPDIDAELSDLPALPDMGDLPELDDLPDLPDLGPVNT